MKKIIKIAIIVLIAFFILGIIKDQIIKSVVSAVASNVTGAEVSIRGFSLCVLSQSVRIRDFKMYNPKGFSPKGILLDLPKTDVTYDLLSLLRGRLHLLRVDVVLKEIGLEKDKEGRLNVDALKIIEEERQKEAAGTKPSKPLALQIDLLNLAMGRVVFKDYSAGLEPAIKVYDINLKKSYRNITSAQQLTALILAEPLKHAGIKGAAIYGVSALAGVAILPVAVAATFVGKDFVRKDLDVNIAGLYNISLSLLKRIGKINKEDKPAGIIHAQVRGADIAVHLKQISPKITQITISAREYMLPKPEIASGILYQITEQLKR